MHDGEDVLERGLVVLVLLESGVRGQLRRPRGHDTQHDEPRGQGQGRRPGAHRRVRQVRRGRLRRRRPGGKGTPETPVPEQAQALRRLPQPLADARGELDRLRHQRQGHTHGHRVQTEDRPVS